MSSWAADVRYTDTDVRRDDNLKVIAETYATNYPGDFAPMVEAREFLFLNGHLTVTLARTVLNCMRSDATAAHLLPQRERPERPARLQLVRENQPPLRKAVITLRTTWHKRYVLSTHKLAVLAHILDKERSQMRFFPYTGNYQAYIYALCGARTRPDIMSDDLMGRRECARCAQREQDKWEAYNHA